MHILVLFTDGKKVLLVKDVLWTLPDSNLWYPLEWKRKDLKSVSSKLLWILSYGIIDLIHEEHTFEMQDLFGSETHKSVKIQVSESVFEKLWTTLKSTTKYMKHKNYQIHQMECIDIQDSLTKKSISVMSIHCIRAFINKL